MTSVRESAGARRPEGVGTECADTLLSRYSSVYRSPLPPDINELHCQAAVPYSTSKSTIHATRNTREGDDSTPKRRHPREGESGSIRPVPHALRRGSAESGRRTDFDRIEPRGGPSGVVRCRVTAGRRLSPASSARSAEPSPGVACSPTSSSRREAVRVAGSAVRRAGT